MSRRTRFTFRFPNANGTALGWGELRGLMDDLLKALRSMPEGPEPKDVTEVQFHAGSLSQQLAIPSRHTRAVYRLRGGPKTTWSKTQRRACEPFYRRVRKLGGEVECGARKLKPVVVPDASEEWRVTEWTTLYGTIWRAGGRDGKVEMMLADVGFQRCDTEGGIEMAQQMGRALYQPAIVSGRAERDPKTGALLDFMITEWTLKPQAARLSDNELARMVAESLTEYDPTEAFKIMRG